MITAEEARIISYDNNHKDLLRETAQIEYEEGLKNELFEIIKYRAEDGYRYAHVPNYFDGSASFRFYNYFESIGFSFEEAKISSGGTSRIIKKGFITW